MTYSSQIIYLNVHCHQVLSYHLHKPLFLASLVDHIHSTGLQILGILSLLILGQNYLLLLCGSSLKIFYNILLALQLHCIVHLHVR